MKAIGYAEFGPPEVLKLIEVAQPVPRADEVLVKVHATTVTQAECLMRRGQPLWGRVILGLRKPRRKLRVLGLELAGEIEAVGADVRRFSVGDQVFGFTGFGAGANAEYKCMPEHRSLALKPANLTYAQAAGAVDGASTALYFLQRKAQVQRGQKVLINGASGSIGTYAVQLAKHFGADVTAVCGTRNMDLVRSLGADQVVDYSQEDFTRNGETYDVIFDTVGRSSFASCKGSLTSNGLYLPTTGLANSFWMLWTSMTRGKRVVTGMSVEKTQALLFLKDLIESNQLKIIIDRQYPLERIVEAHRYVDAGHKTGNVIVTVTDRASAV